MIFSNRFNWVNAEYELFVAVVGSRICIKNGNPDSRHTEYIDFTPAFLDKIIPLMQWESLFPFLEEKNYGKDTDDSIYQDFSKVLVDVNRYKYELDLQHVSEGNPFTDILRLIWCEYETVLKDKELLLPWFRLLGWA